ncbi:zf-TFIIB domain-containing protein [Reyranella sp.]|uniref:TFIIB-type zinc ribbon-containing protein n=1 Tax=Reyranella sp. TaxID=1929291 RepID=UPI003BAB8F51
MADTATPVGDEGLLCPACRVDLVMSERQGIEVDYCPKCRGVWLDRGELDKIIERATSEENRGVVQSASPRSQSYASNDGNAGGHGSGHGKRRGGHGQGGGRESFFSRLFD